MDYLELGPVPSHEECVQVGEVNYYERSLAECAAYLLMLYKRFPLGRFKRMRFHHEFGDYFEVVAILGISPRGGCGRVGGGALRPYNVG